MRRENTTLNKEVLISNFLKENSEENETIIKGGILICKGKRDMADEVWMDTKLRNKKTVSFYCGYLLINRQTL